MRTVELGKSGLRFSALGFGCVKLTTQESRAKAIQTLESALDLGITHYDVARLYGFGQAEGILGEFLKGKRDRVTVTTKFGMRPNEALSKHRKLIGIARQILRKIPIIEQRLKKRFAGKAPASNYTAQEAEQSLDISLRELGTDYVDLFLMHEATPAEAANPELLARLDKEIKKGRIRSYGLGSKAEKFNGNLDSLPPGCQAAQFDSNILAPNIRTIRNESGKGVITYYVLSPLKPLLELASKEGAKVRALSDRAGLDLTNPEILAGLLVDDAVKANPRGVTLVSSVSRGHLESNVRAAEGSAFTEAQRGALAELCGMIRQA